MFIIMLTSLLGSALSSNSVFVVQAATHLKGLAEKAKLNEKHVRICPEFIRRKMDTLTL